MTTRLLVFILIALHTAAAVAQEEPPPHIEELERVLDDDETAVEPARPERRERVAGRRHRVSGFEMSYVHELGALPSPADVLAAVEVELIRLADGSLAAPDVAEGEAVVLPLASVTAAEPVRLHESALAVIADGISRGVAQPLVAPGQPLPRVFAAPDPRDIHPRTGRDLRPWGRGVLRYRAEYTGAFRMIDRFTPRYVQFREPDDRPAIEDLLASVRVSLIETEQGYVAWRPGARAVTLSLAEIAERSPEPYSDAAIQQALLATRDHLTERDLMGVIVRPDFVDGDIELLIVTGVVEAVRSLAAGDRLPDATGPQRINHPSHRRIRHRSPVQRGDVLRRDLLDEYVYRLGRHPGRRVDVAIGAGEQPNTVTLDYLITENRPLLLYAQGSNTGTPQTGRWRARFGLMHTQLTGNDDILAIDYNTAEFSRNHAVTGSYEARFFDSDTVRWRVHGLWSEFDASEVGFADLLFTGETWAVGGELIANIHQDRNFFVDLVGGARFMHVGIENFFFDFVITEGSEDFIIPHLGLRLEQVTEQASLRGSIVFEGSAGFFTGVDREDMATLGRPFPDKDWVALSWDAASSFFLEPIFFGRAWADPTTPATSTLAHEISLGFKGQYAFGNRLIPHHTMVAGGLYSVRGYPESVVSADTVLIGSAEYRFHLPRIFAPQPTPGQAFGEPFRWAPQHVYGRPDWDLILRGFIDAARTIHSDRRDFESDHTLLGAGAGIELSIRRNLNLRVDWGYALRAIEGEVNRGSNRLHFVATVLY